MCARPANRSVSSRVGKGADIRRELTDDPAAAAVETAASDLLARVRTSLDVAVAAVLLKSVDEHSLEVGAVAGMEVASDTRVSLADPLVARAAVARRAVILHRIRDVGTLGPCLRAVRVRTLLAAPLNASGRLVGIVLAGASLPRRLTVDDARLLQSLADDGALGIDRARLLDARQRARAAAEAAQARLAFLADAGVVLAGSLDYEATLQTVARLAVPRLADWSIVTVVEVDGTISRRAAHANPDAEDALRDLLERYPLDPDTPWGVAKVLRTGQPEFLPNVSLALPSEAAEQGGYWPVVKRLGVRSAIVVPLLARGRILGALSFMLAESGRTFDDADLSLAEELARRAALAVDNARLYRSAQSAQDQLRRHAERLAALARASRAFAEASLDLDEVLDTVARSVGTMVGDYCGIFLFSEDRRWLRLAAAYHPDQATLTVLRERAALAPLRADEGLLGEVVRTAKPLLMPAVSAKELRTWVNPAYHPYLEYVSTASLAVVPLLVHGHITGIIAMARVGEHARFTSDDQIFLRDLADRAALAVENALLYQQIDQRNHQLQDLVGRLLMAQERERRRVAYDLHDGLTQIAVSTHQHLQSFAHHHRPRTARGQEELAQALDLAQHTVREARRVIAALRPTALDDFGLAVAIRLQVEALRAAGWQMEYQEALGSDRLPVPVETALFRVAQEALTNIRKHAQTTRACIVLERCEGQAHLEVRDWGCGFDPSAAERTASVGERVGLAGMRERVALLGGQCVIESCPGAGTRLDVTVPLQATEGGWHATDTTTSQAADDDPSAS